MVDPGATPPPTRVVAVDWSGRQTGEGEHIWLAVADGGVLRELENGMTRGEVVERLIAYGRDHPRTVVGLDFAFSFPEWYVRRRGWKDANAVWEGMRAEGEEILATCPRPFWGRPGPHAKRPIDHESFRRTEAAHAPAKSVFQIGGAGAVGTGSLRGMPHLATLAAAGFSVWPFDPNGWPRVVEIYPRQLTRRPPAGGAPFVKSRHLDRRRYLEAWHGDQPEGLRERAGGSEDAFDAAVSALAMAAHVAELDVLEQAEEGSPERLEGRIWARPPGGG